MPPPPHEPAAAHCSPTVAAEVEQWRQDAANSLPGHSRELLKSLDLLSFAHDKTPPTLEQFVSRAAQAVLGALNGPSLKIKNLPTTTLPSAIGRLTHLQELSIDTTQCIQLPDAICNLAKLNTFELSNNPQLTHLPDSIWELRELKSLEVTKTPLTSLPDGIGTLSKLEKLELGGGVYKQLPRDLTELTALTSLEIDHHPNLQALPADLAKLKKLTRLEVLNCPELTSLPEGLGQLASLRMLSLQGCEKLRVLPSDLENLRSLKLLDLSDCTGLQGFPDWLDRLLKSCEEFSLPPQLRERVNAISLTYDSLPVLKKPADGSPTVERDVADWCLKAAKDPVLAIPAYPDGSRIR
jgi:Leucine-rich repeat (LRR) protein